MLYISNLYHLSRKHNVSTMSLSLHAWNVSTREAIAIQHDLRSKIQIAPLKEPITYIAGADISFNRGSNIFYAGFAVFKYPSMKLCGHSLVISESSFPYIPGLLSFRELPALLEAWKQMPLQPDVVIVDGHGIARPRRLGIASHFGLWINRPAIGCAKRLLVGMHGTLDQSAGSDAIIHDRHETLGVALRTRDRIKPVYISPGNLINLDDALRITRQCVEKHRLPEPTRQAHLLVNRLRKGEIAPGIHAYH